MERFNAEYAGSPSLAAGEDKVAGAGRGEADGEYAGGSRRSCGNDDGPDETLHSKAAVSNAFLGGVSSLETRFECREPHDMF